MMEFELFRACGIPVFVHAFLLVYFAWALSNAEESVRADAKGGMPDYSRAGKVALVCTLGFLVLFLTVLLHELGHCLGAKLVGGKVQRILLWPLGGLAFCSSGGGAWGDLCVALAGPLTHLPQWLAWRSLHIAAVASAASIGFAGPLLVDLCASAMSMQIALAAFNLLLPVYPLDCSKVIISACRICGASSMAAALFMCFLSIACIVAIISSMVGVVHIPFFGVGHDPLRIALVLWMAFQTYQLLAQVIQKDVRQHPLFREAFCSEADCQRRSSLDEVSGERTTLGRTSSHESEPLRRGDTYSTNENEPLRGGEA